MDFGEEVRVNKKYILIVALIILLIVPSLASARFYYADTSAGFDVAVVYEHYPNGTFKQSYDICDDIKQGAFCVVAGMDWNGSRFLLVDLFDRIYFFNSDFTPDFSASINSEFANDPIGITWREDNRRIYVVGQDVDRFVCEYTAMGVHTGFCFNATEGTGTDLIEGIEWNGSNYYLQNQDDDSMVEYNTTGNYTGNTILFNDQFASSDLTWNGSNFYVTDDNNVIEFDFEGNTTGFSFATQVPNFLLGLTFADFVDPEITLTNPANGTAYTDLTFPDITGTVFEDILDSIYTNNSIWSQILTASPFTFINQSEITEGVHSVRIFANDTSNNTASVDVFFTYDATPPVLTLDFPVNDTNYSALTWTGINVSVVDNTLDSIITNSSTWPATFTSTPANFTNGTVITEGRHSVLITANDSTNAQDVEHVVFLYDSIDPVINIDSPGNISSISTSYNLNFTVIELNLDTILISVNGSANLTNFSSTVNLSIGSFPDGLHNVSICANDTANNVVCGLRYWTVDATPPVMTKDFPINDTNYSAVTWTGINVSVTDATVGLDSIVTNSSTWPATFTSTPANFTNGTVITEGRHSVSITANDTVNNIVSVDVFFRYDSVFPVISIDSPSNDTFNSVGHNLNLSVIELNLDTILISVNGSANLTNFSSTVNLSIGSFPDGLHNVSICANDTANNVVCGLRYWTVDTAGPTVDNITSVTSITTAVVSFETDQAAIYTIFYGTVPGVYTQGTSQTSSFEFSHTQLISGLARNTQYFFVIESCDVVNCGNTSEQNFTTDEFVSSGTGVVGGSTIVTEDIQIDIVIALTPTQQREKIIAEYLLDKINFETMVSDLVDKAFENEFFALGIGAYYAVVKFKEIFAAVVVIVLGVVAYLFRKMLIAFLSKQKNRFT